MGNKRRIYHGINQARDAIGVSSGGKNGVGILDNDYMSAFDFMIMLWVFQVLQTKGCDERVIERLTRIYRDNITVVVVNNIPGKAFTNHRMSMRQGNIPSVFWFCYGLDPLLTYLEKRLHGIPVYSTPVSGPSLQGSPPLPPLQEVFKLISFVDDLKPAIVFMSEFKLVDEASLMFEKSSGCELHHDPASGKVKFLPLGRWKGSLQQEDIPVHYIKISDHLDMLGVKLRASFT